MSRKFDNKCTCGSKTVGHSIFCSSDFYLDPLSQGKYIPKQKSEKTCSVCFLVLSKSSFKKNSNVCSDCKNN